MRAIALDDNLLLFYEGTHALYGHPLVPPPMVAVATVLTSGDSEDKIPVSNFIYQTDSVFREDSFDPVTRVRRGRLYKSSGNRPEDWVVQPNPAYPRELLAAANAGGNLKKKLNGFHAWAAMRGLGKRSGALIALGTRDAYTLWRVVDIERIVTGEDLLTLRAKNSLGLLPELDEAAVPIEGRAKVIELLDKLVDTAYRAGAPEAIVDSVRSAAQWCVGVYLAEQKGDPSLRLKELGDLARLLEDDRSRSTAALVARLHSRGKANEQHRRQSRSVLEGDAEFALAAMGLLLRELGWAKN